MAGGSYHENQRPHQPSVRPPRGVLKPRHLEFDGQPAKNVNQMNIMNIKQTNSFRASGIQTVKNAHKKSMFSFQPRNFKFDGQQIEEQKDVRKNQQAANNNPQS